MDETVLEQLVRDNLAEFQKSDFHNKENVRRIRKALKLWNKEKSDVGFLEWWKKQDLEYIAALHSYAFWLGTTEKMKFKIFEDIDQLLLPTTSRSWRMPVVITSGVDRPIIEGGFLGREFSIFQYKFSPAPNNELVVTCQEEPVPHQISPYTLDFILDLLSFLVNKAGENFLGFQQISSRKWVSSENALVHGGMSPEIQVQFPDYDFTVLQDALKHIESSDDDQDSFLLRLMHVRHRAILESNLENRLITLWAFIEDLWGTTESDDKLLTPEELAIIKTVIQSASVPAEKKTEIITVMSNLKKVANTKHAKITEQISILECGKEWNIEETKKLHKKRSKFAHGNSIKSDEVEVVRYYVSFLIQILNELITKELSKYGIRV